MASSAPPLPRWLTPTDRALQTLLAHELGHLQSRHELEGKESRTETEADAAAAWLSRHPFPERRVEAVVQQCEAEQRRRAGAPR
jgi:Zn-dependent protease with chaperone function